MVVKTESGMKVKEDLEDTFYGRASGYKNRTCGRGRARSFMWGSTRSQIKLRWMLNMKKCM